MPCLRGASDNPHALLGRHSSTGTFTAWRSLGNSFDADMVVNSSGGGRAVSATLLPKAGKRESIRWSSPGKSADLPQTLKETSRDRNQGLSRSRLL
jgi:hypothetical protein